VPSWNVEWARVKSTSLSLLLGAIVAVACGGAAVPEPAATATATPPASTAPAASAPAETSSNEEALTFTVSSGEVTVAVREQLADRPAPNDAVLTTTGITGTFTLNDDGTFSDDSRIEVDLDGLESDSGLRDRYVKSNTLETDRFPTAVFVPTNTNVALPLPEGPFSFTVVGNVTIKDTTKRVAWTVTGEKSGDRYTLTATNAPAWKFGDFGLEIPRVLSVLSIVDEIRLTVKLEATAQP
jgi:polyisoprenoid-binding protein YceI